MVLQPGPPKENPRGALSCLSLLLAEKSDCRINAQNQEGRYTKKPLLGPSVGSNGALLRTI